MIERSRGNVWATLSGIARPS